MRKISLSNSSDFVLVDEEDYDYLSTFSWSHDGRGYARRVTYFRDEFGTRRQRKILMHREIMRVTDPSIFVDHVDRDRLKNVKKNLRLCTHFQNNLNRKPTSNSSSSFKGVFFNKRAGLWEARIGINGIKYSIGKFVDEVEAAMAYDYEALKLHGDYAYLNFGGNTYAN